MLLVMELALQSVELTVLCLQGTLQLVQLLAAGLHFCLHAQPSKIKNTTSRQTLREGKR